MLIEAIEDKIKALIKELKFWKNLNEKGNEIIYVIISIEHEISNNKDRLNQIQKISKGA